MIALLVDKCQMNETNASQPTIPPTTFRVSMDHENRGVAVMCHAVKTGLLGTAMVAIIGIVQLVFCAELVVRWRHRSLAAADDGAFMFNSRVEIGVQQKLSHDAHKLRDELGISLVNVVSWWLGEYIC